MRNQIAINEKIRQKALERKANGTLKLPNGFKRGFDPRRKVFTNKERLKGGLTNKKKKAEELLTLPFDELSSWLKRKKVFIEQSFSCQKCLNDKWLGEPIKLELDHIDGNKKNEVRNNLRALCPNCHAQTPTWRKKKKVL